MVTVAMTSPPRSRRSSDAGLAEGDRVASIPDRRVTKRHVQAMTRTPAELLAFLLDRENATWYMSAIELEHHVDGDALEAEARLAVQSERTLERQIEEIKRAVQDMVDRQQPISYGLLRAVRGVSIPGSPFPR